jgi:ferredoxin
MATMIVDDCINCGVCEPACPNQAIRAGESLYVIDPHRCTECVGFHGEEQCAKVCPVDACLPDPDREETESALLARARLIHPTHVFATPLPSRFRLQR